MMNLADIQAMVLEEAISGALQGRAFHSEALLEAAVESEKEQGSQLVGGGVALTGGPGVGRLLRATAEKLRAVE